VLLLLLCKERRYPYIGGRGDIEIVEWRQSTGQDAGVVRTACLAENKHPETLPWCGREAGAFARESERRWERRGGGAIHQSCTAVLHSLTASCLARFAVRTRKAPFQAALGDAVSLGIHIDPCPLIEPYRGGGGLYCTRQFLVLYVLGGCVAMRVVERIR